MIPAGTGGAAREIRTIATYRDNKIVEQKKLEEQEMNPAVTEDLVDEGSDLD